MVPGIPPVVRVTTTQPVQSHYPRHSQRKQLLALTCSVRVGKSQREMRRLQEQSWQDLGQIHAEGSEKLGTSFCNLLPVVVDSSHLQTTKADEAAECHKAIFGKRKEEPLRAHCEDLADREYLL